MERVNSLEYFPGIAIRIKGNKKYGVLHRHDNCGFQDLAIAHKKFDLGSVSVCMQALLGTKMVLYIIAILALG